MNQGQKKPYFLYQSELWVNQDLLFDQERKQKQ